MEKTIPTVSEALAILASYGFSLQRIDPEPFRTYVLRDSILGNEHKWRTRKLRESALQLLAAESHPTNIDNPFANRLCVR